MKIGPPSTDVARAFRPQSRERPAPVHGQDARATAGETPAPHFQGRSLIRARVGLGNRFVISGENVAGLRQANLPDGSGAWREDNLSEQRLEGFRQAAFMPNMELVSAGPHPPAQ